MDQMSGIKEGTMMSRLVIIGLLSLSVLLAGCDKAAPPSATQKSTEAETPEKKLADLMKRAEQGNTQAQFNLGSMYHKGEGVPKDAAKAVEWYQKPAEQGNAVAQSNLGSMYDEGEGVPKDAAKAVEWWQKAAEQGNALAQIKLGDAFQWGWGVKKNAAKAFELYEKAATQGKRVITLLSRSFGTMPSH
jgi:TPR repeat protein